MMKKMVKIGQLDIKKTLTSVSFWLSVLGVAALWLVATHMGSTTRKTILARVVFLSGGGVGSMAVWAIAVCPAMYQLTQELEHRYDRLLLIRVGRSDYLVSRVVYVFLCTFITEFMGLVLYVICSIPFIEMGTKADTLEYVLNPAYSSALQYPVLYLLLVFLQFSCLAATLSLLSLMIVLYRPNLMLACMIPVLFLYLENYVLNRLLGWPRYTQVSLYSTACLSVFSSEASWQMGYIQMLIICILSILGIRQGVKWRLEHG